SAERGGKVLPPRGCRESVLCYTLALHAAGGRVASSGAPESTGRRTLSKTEGQHKPRSQWYPAARLMLTSAYFGFRTLLTRGVLHFARNCGFAHGFHNF